MIRKETPAWLRTVLVLLAVLAVLYGLSRMLSGLTPFLAAFAIAYFLNPSLNRFEARIAPGLSRVAFVGKKLDARAIAVLLTLMSVGAIVVATVLLAVPALLGQVEEAVRGLPRMVQNVRTRVEPLLDKVNLRYPDETTQVRAVIEEKVKEKLPELLAPVTNVLKFALSSTYSFIALFIHLFVVPVFAGYLLYDMNRIRAGLVGYI
ncbi:MAG: AI-2E family transporter, partial [Vicinamibacteria bacterium]|nr:AI-2E family transporter [Vicinamibacteria bacterium]